MSPYSWREVQIRHLGTVFAGSDPKSGSSSWGGNTPFVTPVDLRVANGETLEYTERTVARDGAKKESTLVPTGSVIISVRAPIGYVSIANEEVALGRGCCAVFPKTTKAEARYLVYSLMAKRDLLDALGNGSTFKGITSEAIKSLKLPIPSVSEQSRIVRFLNAETAKIDHLITRQQELIDLTMSRLEGWREHAFWGGSTHDTFLIPPEGWKVCRNRRIFEHVDGRSETGDEELLSVSHITGVTPRYMKNVTMFEAESTVGYKLVAKNDLVINTMWAWMGALGISKYEGIVSPAYDVYCFRDLDSVNPMFFDCMYRTAAYVRLMKANSRGIWESRLRLYPEVFLRLSSLVPPRDIQDRLVGENRKKTAEADNLVERCNKAISLLQERRSALITAAVTGQIEV